jgi:LytR cell envelope-related transcriptional attenuator
MPGKHAPASPRSFYLSLARAAGAALGAVALIVIAILVLLNRGDGKNEGALPIVSSSPTRSTSPSPTLSPSPTASPAKSVLPANRVTVDVLNGTTTNGLGRSTANKIEAEGYKIGTVGNQRPPIAKSTIYYRPGRRAEALAFQETFPEFTVVRELKSLPSGTILRVVVGADYPKS